MKPLPVPLRYGCAVLTVLLATLTRMLLQPVLGSSAPFVTFYVAVTLTAWYAGLGPAVLATVLGLLSGAYFFVPPLHSLAITRLEHQVALSLFVSVGLVIASLCESLRAAQRSAEASVQEALSRGRDLEREVAEHQRTEAGLAALNTELEHQRRRLADLVASVPGIVWEAWGQPDAASQRIDFVSDHVEAMLGYRVDQWLATPNFWLTLVHPEDRERAAREAAAIFAGCGSGTSQFRWIARDGRVIWVLAHSVVVRDQAGNPIGMRGVNLDITDRKRAEEAQHFLVEATRVLGSSLDYAATLSQVARLAVPHLADWCAVDLINEHGEVQRVAVEHVDPQKVALAIELQRRYPTDPDASYGLHQVLRTGQPDYHFEITDSMLVNIARDDENLRILRELNLRSYLCVPLQVREKILGTLTFVAAESGRHYGPVDLAMAESLASRAAVAVENARLFHELQEIDRQKDAFLAMLGHELRSPLAAILNTLHLLQRRSHGNLHLEPLRARIQRQVDRMGRLVDDLQDLSRISQGKMLLQPETVDLVPLIRETGEDQRGALEEAGLTLIHELPEEPVLVNGDPIRLAQVLVNLLNNALKFTDAGGQVRVRLTSDQDWATVTVRDTGIGIAPEVLPDVFETFVQAERSLDRSRGGLGLGLAVVKGLVELHGGSVQLASDGLGHGTEVSVRLPVAHREPT